MTIARSARPVRMLTTLGAVLCFIASSCSRKNEFIAPIANQLGNRGETVRAAGSPLPAEPAPADQAGTTENLDNEAEAPAVDVAGVHLVSECFDLETAAKTAGHDAVHCTLSSNSPAANPRAVSFSKLSILSPRPGESFDAIGISGNPHPTLAGHYLVSTENEISLHFEIPTKVLAELKGTPIRMTPTDIKVDGVALADPVVLKPRIKNYFLKSSLCETSTSELNIPFNFEMDVLHISQPSANPALKYNVRWGFNGIPDLKNLTDGSGQTLSMTLAALKALQICEAQFTSSIVLNWVADTNYSLRKIYVMNDVISRYQFLMTDVGPVDTVFNFSLHSFLATVIKNPAPIASVFKTDPNTPPAEWCLLGRTGCIGPHAPLSDEIFANKIPSHYLAKNLQSLLDNKFLIRVVNSFKSGTTKNDCFPRGTTANTGGSAKGADPNTTPAADLCDATIPQPPTVSATTLKIKYVAP